MINIIRICEHQIIKEQINIINQRVDRQELKEEEMREARETKMGENILPLNLDESSLLITHVFFIYNKAIYIGKQKQRG